LLPRPGGDFFPKGIRDMLQKGHRGRYLKNTPRVLFKLEKALRKTLVEDETLLVVCVVANDVGLLVIYSYQRLILLVVCVITVRLLVIYSYQKLILLVVLLLL
jgi:hypothetical protein